MFRQALELYPPPHPNRSSTLNNLALALRSRFEQEGQKNDLDESIYLHRQALELHPPPHPNQSISLNNLAVALQSRFEQEGQQNDLDESIFLNRQALELRPLPHPYRSSSLFNLANLLYIQFKQKNELNDLDESIFLHKKALELRASPHSGRSTSFRTLATLLLVACSANNNDSQCLEEAMSLFFAATVAFRPTLHGLQSVTYFEYLFSSSRAWKQRDIFSNLFKPGEGQSSQNRWWPDLFSRAKFYFK